VQSLLLGCVRKVLSDRSVQNGVEQAERSESRVGSIWSFCAFPNVCCQGWWRFKLLHTFLEIRMVSFAAFVYVNRYKNRTVSVLRPIKITNLTNAFPNAMGAIRPNSAHVPTTYRTRFCAVWPIGSNRSSFPNTPLDRPKLCVFMTSCDVISAYFT
jgi:hypothetical protein